METVVTRSPDLVHTEVDGEVTMMSIDSGKYYGLTRVATDVWNLMEEPRPVQEICDRLLAEYRVQADRCEEEVLSLVRHMADEGLVELDASE